MTRAVVSILSLVVLGLAWLPGCRGLRDSSGLDRQVDTRHYAQSALDIDFPDVQTAAWHDVTATPPPKTLTEHDLDYWDLTLQEVLQIALTNSPVLRDLGGLIVRNPNSVRTIYDPAITETDPRLGVPAALAAFDASFAAGTFFESNDRALNNTFFGGGTRLFQQDLDVFQARIFKRTAVGTQFSVGNFTEFDSNNAPGNAFPSAWTQWNEVEFRQPFLQGYGVDFNRIAGVANEFGVNAPVPGVYSGVLVARINTDISLTEFEVAVRNFVSDVENAYLDLYYAYRELDARIRARDVALETWRTVEALAETERIGADKEAQVREQYFRFQEQVQNALSGRPAEGTRVNSGSAGGTFRGTAGLLVAERRLRLLMGVPITGEQVIRPVGEPILAEIRFSWDDILAEAVCQRAEVRRQKWQIKNRELELIAARNFLLPQLDAVGRYRWRGFGQDFASPGDENLPEFDNAVDNLLTGDFQEWQIGLELNFPFGLRRGHAAVRNAELRLARERAVLRELERELVHDISNAYAELDRAFAVAQTNYNRLDAARQQVSALDAAYRADTASLEALLEAQRRLVDAESTFYRSLVEYALAVKNLHFEKGSLLEYNNVFLEEGRWPDEAYEDAAELERLRTGPLDVPLLHAPRTVSAGPVPQQLIAPPKPLAMPLGEPGPPPGTAPPRQPLIVPPGPEPADEPSLDPSSPFERPPLELPFDTNGASADLLQPMLQLDGGLSLAD